MLAFLSLTVYGQQTVTPESVVLSVFPDGAADVEYRVAVDQNAPRITLPLIGNNYESLLVIGGDGRPLDFRIDQNAVTVDTIGEASVAVTYTSQGLAAVSGALWTVIVDSPAAFTVIFPGGATIVSVDQPPLSINLCGTGALACETTLTMPAGHSEISYTLASGNNGQDTSTTPNSLNPSTLQSPAKTAGSVSLFQQPGYFQLVLVIVGIIAVAAIVGGVIYRRRKHSTRE